ncbi:peptidase M52 [Acrocarpospora corrugata]|uniref:Peptidase M52 n=1 Tax=Acrocarpospora corrugata TaxID=35763 RepID=A0A5M3VZS8_9ACTN|nr:hydrogenase maturation protease [Acrocarpospora corrugata]GES01272.1 peptidase M52 [Acrocarpospora corrugata]
MSRVLVAGIGNIFLGDDGFGVEVVNRLDPAALPATVDVVDYGIRGVHLAYELLDGRHHTLIMVDAMPVDGPPGTLAVVEVDVDGPGDEGPMPVNGHGMHPQAVLDLLRGLGGEVRRVLVVGCAPAAIDELMGLTAPVAAVVEDAVRLVTELACQVAADLAVPGTGQADTECADA